MSSAKAAMIFRVLPNAVQAIFPSVPERPRATTAPAVTGAEKAGTAGSGTEIAPHRGIPNFGGKPDRIVAVCPTKIRYTLLRQR